MSDVDQGTEEPVIPAPDAQEADSSAAEPDSEEGTTALDGEEAPKKIPWFQKRIDSVTAEKWEARRLVEQQAAQIAELTLRLEKGPIGRDKPQMGEFETIEDFTEAMTDWKYEQRSSKDVQARAAEQQAEIEWRSKSEFDQKIQQAALKAPKVLQIINDPYLPVSPAMAEVVRSIDNSAEVLLFLDSHRDEAARIARLPPTLAAYEMGRLSHELTPATKPRRNPPPDPLQPLGGGNASQSDPGTMTDEQFASWRRAQIAKRR